MIAGARDPRVRGVICIDTAISPRYAQPAARQPQLGRNRLYPDLASALGRFRLDPPQSSETLYILDHLARHALHRSEEHTSELQSLMRISYAVFCLKKNKKQTHTRDALI